MSVLSIDVQKKESTCGLEDFLNAFSKQDRIHYIIAPSMSFDKKLLDGIDGIEHYELRSFWEILRVKRKNTFVTFVSSEKIAEDAFNHFVEVFDLSDEEISRLTFIKCPRINNELSLTKNLLMSSECLRKIKKSLKSKNVFLESFVSTEDEQELARVLGVPTWHNHPQIKYFHTKSGNRFLIGDDILMPRGISDLYSKESIFKALIELKNFNEGCCFFMVKLNFGVSGQGNMKVFLKEKDWSILSESQKKDLVKKSFCRGDLFNKSMTLSSFEKRIVEEGAVVEEFVEGELLGSPSAQVMVTPSKVDLISTHKQILDSHGQKFIGGEFPCDSDHEEKITEVALRIGRKLKEKKVYGVTSIDFLVSKIKDEIKFFVIELNIRKGGTTHPFMLSNFALKNEGSFKNGLLVNRNNVSYSYRSNDNFYPCKTSVLNVSELITKSKEASLVFDQKSQKGVIFHLLNTYPDSGKVGYTILAPTRSEVLRYERTLNQVLKPSLE